MHYRRSVYKTDQKRGSNKFGSIKNIGMILVLVGLVLLFIGSMVIFRKSTQEVSTVVPTVGVTINNTSTNGSTSFLLPEATLFELTEHNAIGSATRSVTENIFHVNIRAILLGIDRESQFYQVWLVRPLPFDYISVDEMVTDESGAFVLDWNGTTEKSVSDFWKYTDIVITLQTRIGDPDPQTHVVEGEFGK